MADDNSMPVDAQSATPAVVQQPEQQTLPTSITQDATQQQSIDDLLKSRQQEQQGQQPQPEPSQQTQQPVQPQQTLDGLLQERKRAVAESSLNPFSGSTALTEAQRLYVDKTAMGQVMSAFGHAWDSDKDDLTPETQDMLKKTGNYDDYLNGQKITGNAFIDSAIVPAAYNMRGMAQAWDATKSAMNEFNEQYGHVGAAFGHAAESGALPAAGGMALFGVGAEAGAAMGTPLAPLTAGFSIPIGGFIGGTLAALGGTYATAEGQQRFLDSHPEVAKAAGIDNDTLMRDAKEYPTAAFAGQLAPNLLMIRPGVATLGARALGAGFMGAQEAGTELAHHEELDPEKIALSSIMGAISNHKTALGEHIEGAIPTTGSAIIAARHIMASDENLENHYNNLNPIGAAKSSGGIELEDGEGIFHGTVQPSDEQAKNIQDAVNEKGSALATFKNVATMMTEPLGKISSATQLSGTIHEEARSIEPETFQRYDDLNAQREELINQYKELREQRDKLADVANSPYRAEIDNMQRELDKPTPPKKAASYPDKISDLQEKEKAWLEERGVEQSPQMQDITKKLQDVNGRIQDIAKTGKIAEAYSKAANRMSELNVMGSPEVVNNSEFENETKTEDVPQQKEAVPVEKGVKTTVAENAQSANKPAMSPEEQFQYVINKSKKNQIGAGVEERTAQAAAEIEASRYQALSQMFKGKLGNTAEVYDKFGAIWKSAKAETRETELAQGHRGEMTRSPMGARSIINLIEGAHDASTPIHELGHQFLDQMLALSKHPEAPPSLIDDMKTIRQYLGNKGEAITRAQHEKFARSFERYLMEGVAPNKALARTFFYMKKMITAVYKTVKKLQKEYRIPLKSNVTDVFDHMLETNPEKTVLAPDHEDGRLAYETHKTDANETEPAKADSVRDNIEKEIDQSAEQYRPEFKDALTNATEAGNITGKATGDTETSEGAGSSVKGQGISEQPDGIATGGDNAGSEGTGTRAEPAGSTTISEPTTISGNAEGTGESAARNTGTAAVESGHRNNFDPTVINTVHDDNGAIAAAQQIYEQDPNLYSHKVVGDKEIMALALSGGKDLQEMVEMKKRLHDLSEKSGIPLAAVTQAFRMEAQKSILNVKKAAAEYLANPSEDNAAKLHLARKSALSTTETFSTSANQEGRSFRVYQKQIKAGMKNHELLQLFQQDFAQLPDHLAKFAEQMASMKDDQAAKMNGLSKKDDFFDRLIWYRANCLISGPFTHARYAVGNYANLLAAPLKTVAAATVSHIKEQSGYVPPEERVYYREAQVQMYSIMKGSIDGIRALGGMDPIYDSKVKEKAMQAWREGKPMTLPGQEPSGNYGFQPISRIGKIYGTPGRVVGVLHTISEQMQYEQFIAALSVRKAMGEGLEWGSNEFNARVADLSSSPDKDMMDHALVQKGISKNVQAEKIAEQEAIKGNFEYNSKEYFDRIDQLANNPTKEMIDAETKANIIREAGRKARIAAFMAPTDTKSLGGTLQSAVNGSPVLKLMIPFMKIDMAIQYQSFIEATPLAFINKTAKDELSGVYGQARSSEAWAKLAVGTTIMGATAGLYSTGDITGDGPSDLKERAVWLQDHKSNSVKIMGHWIPLSYIGIAGNQIRVVANLCDTLKYMKPDKNGDMHYAGALASILKGTLDQGFMGDIRQMMDAIHDENGFAAKKFVEDYAASLTPWSVGMSQTAKAIDPNTHQVNSFGQRLESQVPGLSEKLQPKVDVFGNDITGSVQQSDAVTQRLEALKIGIGQPRNTINNVKLTDEQYHDYKMFSGLYLKHELDNYVKYNPDIKNPSAQYMDIVRKIKASKEFGRSQVLAKYQDLLMKTAETGKANPLETVDEQ